MQRSKKVFVRNPSSDQWNVAETLMNNHKLLVSDDESESADLKISRLYIVHMVRHKLFCGLYSRKMDTTQVIHRDRSRPDLN